MLLAACLIMAVRVSLARWPGTTPTPAAARSIPALERQERTSFRHIGEMGVGRLWRRRRTGPRGRSYYIQRGRRKDEGERFARGCAQSGDVLLTGLPPWVMCWKRSLALVSSVIASLDFQDLPGIESEEEDAEQRDVVEPDFREARSRAPRCAGPR